MLRVKRLIRLHRLNSVLSKSKNILYNERNLHRKISAQVQREFSNNLEVFQITSVKCKSCLKIINSKAS